MKTNSFRFVAALLAGLLVATSAWGFAFIKDGRTQGALPIKWEPGTVAIQSKLGTVGGTNFDAAAQAAAQNWNAIMGNLQLNAQVTSGTTAGRTNGINEMVFASDVFGTAFESNVLAVTTTFSSGNERTQGDIIFNTAQTWGVYDGPTQGSTRDLKRVALHELGHLLGLDHPDEDGQTFNPPLPIMNSRITSNDTLTFDDINGARSLYGPPGSPANDSFASAIELVLNSSNTATGSGTNTNATKQTGEPNHAGTAGGRSVWWRWTAPAAGSATIDTRGSFFDTVLAVYTGSAVNTLAVVGSNDDLQNDQTAHIQASSVTFTAAAGMIYYFAVDGWDGDSAGVTLNLAFSPSVTAPPTITSQPVSVTVTAGGTASFSVTATNATSYQWFFNGGAIGGATSATYSITNAQSASHQGNYFVMVSNGPSAVTSNTVTLTVNAVVTPPPSSGGGGGGGGGGAPSLWFLGALSLLGLARFLRRRA